jgi:DNA (cytosine-5)-methyltransferase 1
MGYYRRLAWDEPSPTVVTTPAQKGTLFCHPEEMRLLSIKEYKRIQGFPDDWEITGSLLNKYKLIGDAVPVHLSYAIAKKLASLL